MGRVLQSNNWLYAVSATLVFVMLSVSNTHAVESQIKLFSASDEYDVQQTIHNFDVWKDVNPKSLDILTFKPNPTTNLAGFKFDQQLNLIDRITSRPGQQAFFFGKSTSETWSFGGSCAQPFVGSRNCNAIVNTKSGDKLTPENIPSGIDSHELLPDGLGNFWILSYPTYSCEEYSLLCGPNARSAEKRLVDCEILKISLQGKVLFRWSAKDNLPKSEIISSYKLEMPSAFQDIYHCNSIDIIDDKSILVSFRNTNSVYSIDTNSGRVNWKVGGNFWPKISAVTTGLKSKTEKIFVAQHDARSLGNDMFSVFNNNSHSASPAEGLIFSVKKNTRQRAIVKKVQSFVNPSGDSSLCQGGFTKISQKFFLAQWGCSPNGLTLFSASGIPIVSVKLPFSATNRTLFVPDSLVMNKIDWQPWLNSLMGYRAVAFRY